MTDLTDLIEATTGVVSLAVSILALRESQLQRRPADPVDLTPKSMPPIVAPPSGPDVAPGWSPTYNTSRQSQPLEGAPPSLWLVCGGAFIFGLLYSLLIVSRLTTPAAQLIAAFIVLALAIACFLGARSPLRRVNWRLVALSSVLAVMSFVHILNIFTGSG